MSPQIIDLDEFLERFVDSIDGIDRGSSEYTLILGAGLFGRLARRDYGGVQRQKPYGREDGVLVLS